MHRNRRRLQMIVVLVVVGALAVSIIAAVSISAGRRESRSKATTPKVNISVFAAASLSAAFTDIVAAFERANPGVTVTLNLAGSSTLVTQIRNGAPADVFASADTANMDLLVREGLVDAASPVVFTRNKLMIVVPTGNPLRVKGLADLGRSEVYVALGAVGVPAGDYGRQVLSRAGVAVAPKSLEPSVSAIVSKAALREIDAGIVYVTDGDAVHAVFGGGHIGDVDDACVDLAEGGLGHDGGHARLE